MGVTTAFGGTDGRVAIVTIDRPAKQNALDMATMLALARALEGLGERCAAVVITGAGGHFCAGVDLSDAMAVFNGPMFRDYQRAGTSRDDPMRARRVAPLPPAPLTRCRHWLERLERPVVAAVEGVAITAGLELVLGADVVVAARGARFADTHGKFGIMPFWGLSQKLSAVVGANNARLVSLAAAPIGAEAALRMGLVQQLTPDGGALEAAVALADAMAAHPPQQLAAYKRLIVQGAGLGARRRARAGGCRVRPDCSPADTAAEARKREFAAAMTFYSSAAFRQAAAGMAKALQRPAKL